MSRRNPGWLTVLVRPRAVGIETNPHSHLSIPVAMTRLARGRRGSCWRYPVNNKKEGVPVGRLADTLGLQPPAAALCRMQTCSSTP